MPGELTLPGAQLHQLHIRSRHRLQISFKQMHEPWSARLIHKAGHICSNCTSPVSAVTTPCRRQRVTYVTSKSGLNVQRTHIVRTSGEQSLSHGSDAHGLAGCTVDFSSTSTSSDAAPAVAMLFHRSGIAMLRLAF